MKKRKIMLFALSTLGLGAMVAAPTTNILKPHGLVMRQAGGQKFYSEFGSHQDVIDAGRDFNVTINEEGMTLLKNDYNVLPFEGVKRLSVFGKASVKPAYSGGGSGQTTSQGMVDFYQSLEEVGYVVNPSLKAFYENNAVSGEGPKAGGMFSGNTFQIGETPVDSYTPALKETFKGYNDAALVFLERSGSEGADNPRALGDYMSDPDEVKNAHHYFELSVNETAMIEMVKKSFNKIVIVVNSPSPLEVAELVKDPKIGGIIWAGIPGMNGFKALGRILNGTVNPSGKTADTWVTDYRQDPTWNNFGDGSQTTGFKGSNYTLKDPDGKNISGRYAADGSDVQGDATSGSGLRTRDNFVRYEEGIYVNYGYYETVGHDKGEEWYKEHVTFPLGYGLSYTNFEYEIVDPKVTEITKDGSFSLDVKVTNKGTRAGKEVVQLYFKPPYIDGEIEKTYEKLAAFAKTDLIAPGKSDTVTLTFNFQDMASYDADDANKNKHVGYELDAGKYQVSLNTSAHDIVKSYNLDLKEDINYDVDRTTGNKVENRFDKANSSLPTKKGMFEPMSRAKDNYMKLPDAPKEEETHVDDKMLADIIDVYSATKMETKSTIWSEVYGEDDPRIISDELKQKFIDKVYYQQDPTKRETLFKSYKEMGAMDYDDPEWEKVLNNLTWSEIVDLVHDGGYKTTKVDFIGKENEVDSDGPAGIRDVAWCCEVNIASTWNVDIARRMGELIGEESLWANEPGWYAPAMNAHRSTFGGRCFEYYSEEPLLSGKIGAGAVGGAQSKGVRAYIKHFALNDQETSRQSLNTFASEQAIREIYLKPFELSVKEGGATGVMGGFNQIGTVAAHANYGLLTEVLRNEWGFKGAVVTDYGEVGQMNVADSAVERFVSGLNFCLNGGPTKTTMGTYDAAKNQVLLNDENGTPTPVYSYWWHMRNNAKNILWMSSHSNAQDNFLDKTQFTNQTVNVTSSVSALETIACDVTKLGTTDVNYKLTSGTLPQGLSLSADGRITGKTTQVGTTKVKVTLYADGYIDMTREITIVVNPAVRYNGELNEFQIGHEVAAGRKLENDAYKVGDKIMTGSGSSQTQSEIKRVEYSATGLPAGLALAADGTLTGTPTVSTISNVEVTVYGIYQGRRGEEKVSLKETVKFVVKDASGNAPVEVVPSLTDKELAEKAQKEAEAAKAEATKAKADAATAQEAADAAKKAAEAAQARAEKAEVEAGNNSEAAKAARAEAKAAQEAAEAAQKAADAAKADADAKIAAAEAKAKAAQDAADAAKKALEDYIATNKDTKVEAKGSDPAAVTGIVLGTVGLLAGLGALIMNLLKKKTH